MSAVNWEAIGAIGDLVGGIGVIATLLYLAAQIRQNSGVVRSATRQAVSTAQMEMGIHLATNAEMRASAARWLEVQPPPSSPDARMRDEFFIRATLRMFENQYHQHEDGTFEDAMWAGYAENMVRSFAMPGFREWWPANRSLYSTDFAAFVDARIEGSDPG